MTSLTELRPATKLSVYEVLGKIGFNLESWATNSRGVPNDSPAVNGRAYAWSFRDAANAHDVFMLWYEDMQERDGRVFYRQNWHGVIAELDRTRPITARRADSFLKHVSDLKLGKLVRVGIVEGSRAKSSDDQASSVAKRVLDPEVWHLSYWDPMTSTYEFTRGRPASAEVVPAAKPNTAAVPQPYKAEGELQADIEDIIASDVSPTEKERLVSARLGQGKFRLEVLARWHNGCAVTGATTLAAIRASHCKPWRSGTNHERLDAANGLPLVATLDALFDVGLITFAGDGRLIASPELTDNSIPVDGLRLRRAPADEEAVYLAYHRANIYRR